MIEKLRQIRGIIDKIIAECQPPSDGLIERFLAEQCGYVPGAVIEFKDLFEHLKLWCMEQSIDPPGKMEFIHSLPERFAYGIRYGNKRYVGNVVLLDDDGSIPAVKVDDTRPWIVVAGRLKRKYG